VAEKEPKTVEEFQKVLEKVWWDEQLIPQY